MRCRRFPRLITERVRSRGRSRRELHKTRKVASLSRRWWSSAGSWSRRSHASRRAARACGRARPPRARAAPHRSPHPASRRAATPPTRRTGTPTPPRADDRPQSVRPSDHGRAAAVARARALRLPSAVSRMRLHPPQNGSDIDAMNETVPAAPGSVHLCAKDGHSLRSGGDRSENPCARTCVQRRVCR